ncbi:hypothetical protein H0H93_006540 [Arthromyces matolae]|nr:hypothetical protein H0H93_006540 [Arthromyces matolae]
MTSKAFTDADILPTDVQTFLNSNPPRFEWTLEIDDRPDLVPPSIFYERHLDSRLMLQQVHVVPLESLLSTVVDLSLSKIAEKGISLPTPRPGNVFSRRKSLETIGRPNNVASVSETYVAFTSRYSRALASTLLLHPEAGYWVSSLRWGDLTGTGQSNAASLDCEGLELAYFDLIPKSLSDTIDDETREIMKALEKPRHALAWWQLFFFDDEARALLEDLDRIASADVFRGFCGTSGHRTPTPATFPVLLDASHTPWMSPISSLDEAQGLASRADIPVCHVPKDGNAASRTRTSHSRDGKDKRTYHNNRPQKQPDYDTALWPEVRPEVHELKPMDSFLLRAWAQSVSYDTTFIIFHCGTHERIGFRHRESRTLFVSNLIDVHNCSNPAYGRLHTGLYLSILQDAMDRMKERTARATANARSRKRRRESAIEPTNRRYKTRSAVAKGLEVAENFAVGKDHLMRDRMVVKHHASKRILVLINLRFDNYNSISPASFLRIGIGARRKTSYGPSEYMSIVLTSKIASGAIGDAHHGQLELLINGCTRQISAVVKLAFAKHQVEKMHHEYSIYQHLYKNGVHDGIPYVFGLFEDVETGAAALVMNYVGPSICTLRPRYTAPGAEAPETIENAYIQLLKEIHRAGVSHGDIREENMTLMDDGKVAILDFDRAKLYPSDLQKDIELEQLHSSLHDTTVDLDEIFPPTPGPTPPGTVRPRLRWSPRYDSDGVVKTPEH